MLHLSIVPMISRPISQYDKIVSVALLSRVRTVSNPPLRCGFFDRRRDWRGKDSHRSSATAFQPPHSTRDGKDVSSLTPVVSWVLQIYYGLYNTAIESQSLHPMYMHSSGFDTEGAPWQNDGIINIV